jgi:hypothetical protein
MVTLSNKVQHDYTDELFAGLIEPNKMDYGSLLSQGDEVLQAYCGRVISQSTDGLEVVLMSRDDDKRYFTAEVTNPGSPLNENDWFIMVEGTNASGDGFTRLALPGKLREILTAQDLRNLEKEYLQRK